MTATVYEQPRGIWRIRIDGHDVVQHCFTRESAEARARGYLAALQARDNR